MCRILFFNFNPKSVNNTHLGFIQSGCEVLNYRCKSFNIPDETLVQEMNKLIDNFKPDIVFSYGWWKGRVNINTFQEVIKKRGIMYVFWAFDDPECFETISLPAAKGADVVFTSVAECIPKYRQNGVNAHLLLHGCYPAEHKRVPPIEQFKHDIVLLAHNYNVKWNTGYFAYRLNGINNLVKPLVENDYDLMVWGLYWDKPDRIYNLPWKYYGGVCSYGTEADIYSSCKIALGLQSVGDSKTHFSVRTFEAMACGAFHLSQYSQAIENYFKKGVHMEWSKSPQETLDIVNFYLKNDMLREKIALQGKKEVCEKHTLEHRAKEALEILKKYI